MRQPDLFSWGIWISTSTPYGGRASGAMTEDKFRPLLKDLFKVYGDFDRALDQIKALMIAELGKVK